ncbi:MAG: nucleotidyltransferase domain-containing protein [Candidatus Omnitrophica bacterium]|nr:nucleotidyltransferase domain-containing protein [Candidatus Omnitrophota bacterium]
MKIDLDISTINKIQSSLKNNTNIKKILLFGSRAKGTAKNGSDIDLALVGDRISFSDLCAIGAKLDELDLPYKIDLVIYNFITNQELKEHIDRVGVEI